MDFIKEIPKVYLFIELLYYQSLKETTEQNKTNKETWREEAPWVSP